MSLSKFSAHIEDLIAKAKTENALSRKEIVELLKMPGNFSFDLFAAADAVRKE